MKNSFLSDYNIVKPSSYKQLKNCIGQLLEKGRVKAAKQVNNTLLQTYWYIGYYIVEFEQDGAKKANYGSALIDKLSNDLTIEIGKGFSRSNLFQIRQFYINFPNVQTLSEQLSWSHYIEILKIEDSIERNFYINQCEKDMWSVRELKRQMNSMLFHRIVKSKKKEEIIEISKKGIHIQKPEDLIKDPYIFEFLNIPQKNLYKEGELEQKLIENLETFLLELGKGFAFIGRQYRISIGNRHFFVDLVFYHRILKCFVLIDLKRGEIEHQDIGQMNLYLNYFQKEENLEDDNPPIGILLGAYKDHILMEYATENISNKLFVSKYQLYLPKKEELAKELEKLLSN